MALQQGEVQRGREQQQGVRQMSTERRQGEGWSPCTTCCLMASACAEWIWPAAFRGGLVVRSKYRYAINLAELGDCFEIPTVTLIASSIALSASWGRDSAHMTQQKLYVLMGVGAIEIQPGPSMMD